MPVLGREPGTHIYRDLKLYPDDEQFPGIVVLWLVGELFFATADALGDRFRELALSSEQTPQAIVLDCRSVNFIDSQGSAALREIIELAQANGITFRLARTIPDVLEILKREGVVGLLGLDNIHESVDDAVETERALMQQLTA
jgi:SulP family sulfate permease